MVNFHTVNRLSGALLLSLVILWGCNGESGKASAEMPVGMFDSGTGGLTVMEAFLALDEFDNSTGKSGSDGIPDFRGELFTFLADQANMPYGVYNAEGKGDYLKELILNDAKFLTTAPNNSKIVVVACNTATAYGLTDIDGYLKQSGTGVKVIGVINAAVKALMENIPSGEKASVGVMATAGTISSGGYERTILEAFRQRGDSLMPYVFNQPGVGFAEAVDMEPSFLKTSATAPRDEYKGPQAGSGAGEINPELMKVYRFDTSVNALLVEKDSEGYKKIQLNSAGNYARFHMVSLVENLRKSGAGVPMKNIILGCTHYPYLLDTLEKVASELRELKLDGRYPYRDLLPEKINFIDPAKYVAIESYISLRDDNLLARREGESSLRSFISIPAPGTDSSLLDERGGFTYSFKYGRVPGEASKTYIIEELQNRHMPVESIQRIRERLPLTFSLMKID